MVRTASDAPYGSKQLTWCGEKEAPVYIEIMDATNGFKQVTEICFHEVWWADLDEPTNLNTFIRFWWWGLSLWAEKWEDFSNLEGGDGDRVRPPRDRDEKRPYPHLIARLRLAWIGIVVFLILPILFILNLLLRTLGIRLDLNIVQEYVGDVKFINKMSD